MLSALLRPRSPRFFAILRRAQSWFLPLPNVEHIGVFVVGGGGVLSRKCLGNLRGPGTPLFQQLTFVGAAHPHGLGRVGQKHLFLDGSEGTSALPYALNPPLDDPTVYLMVQFARNEK